MAAGLHLSLFNVMSTINIANAITA